jgi:hypothetical protein
MDNNNPAEMSNQDLENDMQQKNQETPIGNQEKLSKSTAAEGTLKTPEEDGSSIINIKSTDQPGNKQELDNSGDLIDPEEKVEHNGNMPDPEEIGSWESNDDDVNKISS